nr:ARID DNA-binding domain-containing protein [Tanacetum cinerariifolium]
IFTKSLPVDRFNYRVRRLARAGGIYPGILPLDRVEVLGSDYGVTTSLQLSRNSRSPMLDHQDKFMMKAQLEVPVAANTGHVWKPLDGCIPSGTSDPKSHKSAMASPSFLLTYPFLESKWSRPNQRGIGLYNSWYHSKSGRHLRSRHQLHAIQREIRRENEAHLGTCMRKISKDCKEMLKKKLEEIVLHNNTISPPHSSNISENKYKRYKCLHCKQRGHILKNCPTYNKSNGKNICKDSSENTKESKEDVKPANLTVVLKYPESIHFSIKCMIKGTDHGTWDDIWYISNHTDKHLCYKQDFFCNIKEAFTMNKLDDQMKLLFTYGIAFLNLIRQDDVVSQEWDIFRKKFDKVVKWFYNYYLEKSLPGPIPPIIDGVKIYLFDLYKLVEGLRGYLSVHFGQEFGTIGEILGLPKGNEENLKRCYIQYLDVFTSYYKTARAPQQEYKSILKMPTRKIEEGKDRDCLMSHQWNFEDGKDDQPGHTNQNLQRMYTEPSTSRNSEKEVSSNDSSEDLVIVT